MDYGAVKARVEDFDARHGANVLRDQWIFFEDGATREVNPVGALLEPPSDPRELAQNKLRYHTILLTRATNEFEERKRYYLMAAKANLNQRYSNPPLAVPDTAAAELGQLRDRVMVHKKNHDEALAEVERTKPSRLRAMETQSAINREQNQKLISRLQGIEV